MPDGKQQIDDRLHWYKDAIIYELHIKAFCDSNGDGIGDFNGLMQKLDYLQNLGITAIWVLPFYPSPLRDDGYDIADYYSINPAYGDLKQFKRFLNEAHNRGLKVITELVINHTSDQHPWFQRARKAQKGSPEREFYVWTDDPHKYRDVRIIFQDFEASNWTWDPVAKQYYWHRFFHHQPDLNYDNLLVQDEVFKMIDYWCEMGVDGFRLDAVPYLFEREGTNCENLPETHVYLKKLRKHVDQSYPGTLLLAEANMWPEDSASYFGNGDECHMNYHFPVMPRMFMSLQMEERFPITDIFDQTPEIPLTCQWAIFLRNHDELTLEMVTDEERDYMYKVYVKDPKARINLGIRHRLAPLMDNNRKKIELLNYLLFSLPGTPVIYYGDEIGMGDNFYLGDRDGVRTPMQWDSDRNAGFSNCNPQKLYLPVILDPEYHYESVNVEMQSRSTSSLLWWMKRIINTRKKYRAFSRGDMRFINAENPKILAFTRSYGDESVLVIANLSRFIQPVELDLKDYSGFQPVEVFSKNKFPSIKADNPYFLTLGPHDCHWFMLQKTSAAPQEKSQLPGLELKKWNELIERQSIERLENYILPEYLQKMRWFGGKARVVQGMRIIDSAIIPLEESSCFLVLMEVYYQSGLPEIYQVALGFADEEGSKNIQESCPAAVICNLNVGGQQGLLYDAYFGQQLQQEIFNRLANNHDISLKGSELQFTGRKQVKKYFSQQEKIRSRVLSAEQSNTSITYENKYFLKIYRKVDRAVNPDVEMTHYLSETAGFKHVPAFAGVIEWKYSNGSIVLGMMQEMVENSSDAWTYMLDRLATFNEKLLSKHKANLPSPSEMRGSLTAPVSYDQLPDDMKELLDATVAERARLLGVRTAEMHLALASASAPEFRPEEFSLHYQRSLFSSFQTLVRSTFQSQVRNLRRLPDSVRKEAEDVLSMKDDILHTFRRIYLRKFDVVKTRIHGDYHLGQVLFTGKDFIILDFEGEPSKSYSERRLKRSPLRDVAGMIRSFHYAAYGALLLNDQVRADDMPKLLPFAEQWYHYMSGFFMQSYLERVRGTPFIPSSREDLDIMLQTYLLEKAIYELNYELNNRPEWLLIPLKGIRAIMNRTKQERMVRV
jgi:maltose alpha-D-glucosyltransferase / alpha-amylase